MTEAATTAAEGPPRHALTARGATVLGIGSMVGAGIFALLGEAGAVAGAAVWVSFLIGGAVAGLLGYVCAKLGMKYPSSVGLSPSPSLRFVIRPPELGYFIPSFAQT